MENRFYQVQLFLLCLTAFVLPLYIKLTSITLGILFLMSFVYRKPRNAVLKKFKCVGFWLYLLPIVVAIAGLAFSGNYRNGFDTITVLSSMFFFMLIFAAFDSNTITNRYQYIHSFFVMGIVAAFFLCLGLAYLNYSYTPRQDYFFYSRLSSAIMSPNHLSNYVLWAIVLLLTDLSGMANNFVLYNSAFYKVVILVLLIIFLFLLASKAAFLTFCVLMVLFVSLLIAKRIIPWAHAIVLIVIMSMLGLYLYESTNIKGRLDFAYKVLGSDPQKRAASPESTALRISAFEASKNIIHKNMWLGVGTGNVQQSMIEYYKNTCKSGAYVHQTNPHNQYLFSWIMNGVFGIAALLLMFFVMMKQAIVTKNALFVFWNVNMIFMFFTDDILTIQIGVVFFAFYSAMYLTGKKEAIIMSNETLLR